MSLNPAGTVLTMFSNGSISPSVNVTLIVDSLTIVPTFEPFDRLEYDNDKIKTARTLCGERLLTGENLGGKPFQIVYDCMSDTNPYQLGPNSDSNFIQIKQTFQINRYTVNGAMSTASAVNGVFNVAEYHQGLLAEFQFYLAQLQGDIPRATLMGLRSGNFNYLTTTGCSVAGTALESGIGEVLLISFAANTELSIATNSAGTTREFYKTYSLVFETRSVVNLDAVFGV